MSASFYLHFITHRHTHIHIHTDTCAHTHSREKERERETDKVLARREGERLIDCCDVGRERD